MRNPVRVLNDFLTQSLKEVVWLLGKGHPFLSDRQTTQFSPKHAICETQNCQPRRGFWEGSSGVFPYPFTSACQQRKVLDNLGSSFETCIEGSSPGERMESHHPAPTLAEGRKTELKLFLQHQLDGRNRTWAGRGEGHGEWKAGIQNHRHTEPPAFVAAEHLGEHTAVELHHDLCL